MDFNEAYDRARAFRDERAWGQFHNPKDLALAISVEASELVDVFRWSGADLEVGGRMSDAQDELADIIIYCMYFADTIGADIPEVVARKLDKNAQKYPADAARGSSRKYTEL